MSYAKLFGSILDSSIWQQSKETKLLWVTILAMKDRDGMVEASVPGLAKRAGLTIEETMAGLEILMAPDRWSRTPDNEGRRIEEALGGWRVLNHDLYRDKLDLDERREKTAARVAKHRAKKIKKRDVTLSNAGNARKRHADTYAEAEAFDHAPASSVGSGSGSSTPSSQPPDLAQPPGDRDHAREVPTELVRGPLPHPPPPPPIAPTDDARVRQRLVERFRAAIGEARRMVAEKHGLTGVRCDLPLHGGEDESELRRRLKDAGDRAAEDLEHVIAVATAEAMASENGDGIKWLGWILARQRPWDRALRTTPDLAVKPPQGARRSVFDVVDQAVADIEAGKKVI